MSPRSADFAREARRRLDDADFALRAREEVDYDAPSPSIQDARCAVGQACRFIDDLLSLLDHPAPG